MRASYVLLLVQYRGRYRQGSEIGGALIEIYNVENIWFRKQERRHSVPWPRANNKFFKKWWRKFRIRKEKKEINWPVVQSFLCIDLLSKLLVFQTWISYLISFKSYQPCVNNFVRNMTPLLLLESILFKVNISCTPVAVKQ